ncbi:hypothetical protein KAR48_12370 [bacterium]|nr:hypothetical protein [bacterium]
MKLILVVWAFYSVLCPLSAQQKAGTNVDTANVSQIVTELDSVDVPNWRLHFGLFTLPALNNKQQMKKRYQEILHQIEILEEDVEEKQALLDNTKDALHQLLNGQLEESNSSSLVLGLFKHRKKTKGIEVIYDEKSLFWGAIKWGKREPKVKK